MNGPSPTRTRSAQRPGAAGRPAAATRVRTSVERMRRLSMPMSPFLVPVVERRPRRYPAVDPLLRLDHEGAHDREYDQAREHLLGLHHLPGMDEQIAHAPLA